MAIFRFVPIALSAILANAGLAAVDVAAQTPVEFYKGRQIDMVIGGGTGGGVDIFGRLVARHIVNYIPGQPTVVARNMPAAGGMAGISHVFNISVRDGSTIGTMARGPLLEPLIGSGKAQFDPQRFGWIGSLSKDVSICGAWHTSKFKNLGHAKQSEMIVAGTGGGSETDTFPILLNQLIGTKFNLVKGYRGTQDTLLAIERGEVDGRCGWGLSSLQATNPDWLRDKKINILLFMALEKPAGYPDVPLIFDLVKNQEDRQLLTLLLGSQEMARPFFTTPDVPSQRLEALRSAFQNMAIDRSFIAEANKLNVEVEVTSAAQIEKLLGAIYASPEKVVNRAKDLVAPKN